MQCKRCGKELSKDWIHTCSPNNYLFNLQQSINKLLEAFEKKYDVYFEWKYNIEKDNFIWNFSFSDMSISIDEILIMLKYDIELKDFMNWYDSMIDKKEWEQYINFISYIRKNAKHRKET